MPDKHYRVDGRRVEDTVMGGTKSGLPSSSFPVGSAAGRGAWWAESPTKPKTPPSAADAQLYVFLIVAFFIWCAVKELSNLPSKRHNPSPEPYQTLPVAPISPPSESSSTTDVLPPPVPQSAVRQPLVTYAFINAKPFIVARDTRTNRPVVLYCGNKVKVVGKKGDNDIVELAPQVFGGIPHRYLSATAPQP